MAEALGERWNGCYGGGFVTCVFVSRLTWSEMNFRDDAPGATPNQRSMNLSSKRSDEAKWNISIWRLVRCWPMLAQPFWSWRPQTFQWDLWKIYENLGIFTGLEESVSICCFWYLVKDLARYSIRPDRVVSSNSIILLVGIRWFCLKIWYPRIAWFIIMFPCYVPLWNSCMVGVYKSADTPIYNHNILIYIYIFIHTIILYYIVVYNIILHYSILYCTVSYYLILYHIVVYYSIV